MLRKLLAPIIGLVAGLSYFFITIFFAILLFCVAFFKLIPVKKIQKCVDKLLYQFPNYWTCCIVSIMRLTSNIEWDIKGLDGLSESDWYLMISNHVSWADILVLGKVFYRKIPPPKFFMKKDLLWQLPFAGVACWLMGFPVMQRHSKEELAKHPELRGKDIETTRKACEKFKEAPTTVVNFVEGGRFSTEYHTEQNSPYQYLLKPKAGGIAFVLATMGDILHKIIDVTIIYQNDTMNFWNFLCGRVNKVIVRVELLPIVSDIIGDYENDPEFREFFQSWINQLWEKKDQTIKTLMLNN